MGKQRGYFARCDNCLQLTYHERIESELFGDVGYRCTNCMLSKLSVQSTLPGADD